MRILSIDTTSMQGSVALTDGRRLVAQEQQGVPGTHSERLMASIDHLLSLARWERGEIEGIAVATGPGSFTGLRIGLATAKGMALALGCPIAGVSSLRSLAENGASFPGSVAALVDARRGEIYSAIFGPPVRGRRKALLKECALSPGDLVSALEKTRGRVLFVGDGVEIVEAKVKKVLGARAVFSEGAERMPQAANLAFLTLPRLVKGGDDLSSLSPEYVRRSDAEIGFNRRQKPGTKPRSVGKRSGAAGRKR